MLLRYLAGHPAEEQALREFLVAAPENLLARQVSRTPRTPVENIERVRADFRRIPLNQIAPPLLFPWGSLHAPWVRGPPVSPRAP